MWPFPHKHDWENVAIRYGPAEHPSPNMTTYDNYWYWRCSCGSFMLSVSGGEHVKVTGKLPKELRDATNWRVAAWLDQWLPKCKAVEGPSSEAEPLV